MGSWSLAKAGEAALLAAVVVLGGLGDLELLASADFALVQKVAAVKKSKENWSLEDWYFLTKIVPTYCEKKCSSD